MTYVEVLSLITERGETILAQDVRTLITDQHRYLRALDAPEAAWQEDTEPGSPKQVYGKGGSVWVWKREELLPDPPTQFPEGT
jgi:hypothetical protein